MKFLTRKKLIVLSLSLVVFQCVLIWFEKNPGYLLVDGIILGANIILAMHNSIMIRAEKVRDDLIDANDRLVEALNRLNSAYSDHMEALLKQKGQQSVKQDDIPR